MCPKARVFINLLLLPTKSTSLNFQVRQFNNNLIDFAFVQKNVFIIDHPSFGDVLSDSNRLYSKKIKVKKNCKIYVNRISKMSALK